MNKNWVKKKRISVDMAVKWHICKNKRQRDDVSLICQANESLILWMSVCFVWISLIKILGMHLLCSGVMFFPSYKLFKLNESNV